VRGCGVRPGLGTERFAGRIDLPPGQDGAVREGYRLGDPDQDDLEDVASLIDSDISGSLNQMIVASVGVDRVA
jgi:hypothetical protein